MSNELLVGLFENILNPVIIFSDEGNIRSLNKSAELLAGFVNLKNFYDLALNYAPKSFGFKTIMQTIKVDRFNFFAATIGYLSEDELIVMLYQQPSDTKKTKIDKSEYKLSNIYALIDLALISSNKTKCKKEFDLDIPEFKLHQESFLKLLRSIFELLNDEFSMSLRLKVGEYVEIDQKRCKMLELKICGKCVLDVNLLIKQVEQKVHLWIKEDKGCMSLDIPIILE